MTFQRLTTAVALMAGCLWGTAQNQTAVFEDGRKMDYNLLSEDCEDMKPLWLHWGALGEGSIYGAQIDTWIPGKARIQLTTSILGTNVLQGDREDSVYVDGIRPGGRPWRLRGHVFLKSWTKSKTKRISLKSESTGYKEVTSYTMEMEMPRTSYLSFHGGIGYQNLAATEDINWREIALGVSLVRARHLDFEVYDEGKTGALRRRGGSFMELYADALIFTGADPYTVSLLEEYAAEGREPRSLGMEVAWKGMATGSSKGGFGLWVKSGVMVGPYRIHPLFGAGFSFSLMDDARKIG